MIIDKEMTESYIIKIIQDWILVNLKPTKAINKNITSYGLKHLAEQDLGYISNEQFIKAAQLLGFKNVPDGANSPNFCFNFSKESIKELQKKRANPNMS